MSGLNFLSKIETLYQQFKTHDATQSDRLNRYRNIEPESAEFLNIFIRAQQSRHILEIGTSTGYSTLWLAYAAQATQGKITTIEIDVARSAMAQKNAIEFLLDDHIDFIVSDAQEYLRHSSEKFDLILLDAERDAYCEYWRYLPHLLNEKGGILIVDNIISHQTEVQAFLDLVQSDTTFTTTTLPIGAGLFLVTSL
ncbi:methyltransferase [Acinetobacter sp. ANC 4558]|uniref:O-methyltransferase n=1 Tax=Acinetobacter sp. ANC 4558 TaxID=1977876 RepID=UPI000A35607D|nr:class I SAM-dependent methyltransferase [Acinetobacter sp. ANC 4558]OTG86058.1 methyltransferase [Acinetobacter sp. ANC 4558]